MTTFRLTLTATFILLLSTITAAAAPVVLGLANKHPLSEAQVGAVLINELRCSACHAPSRAMPKLPERTAPDLSDVGGRVSAEYLKRFIAAPMESHDGTTMPDLLSNESAEQRQHIAEAIAHFLVSQSAHVFERTPIDEADTTIGKDLFHSIGCIACHSPRDDGGKETTCDGVVELGHVPAKYSQKSLSEFLFQPTRVRTSGRMPDMKLTRSEAKQLAAYLLGKGEAQNAPLAPPEKLVAEGKQFFQQYNCAACHQLGEMKPAAARGALQDLNPQSGCLATAASRAPQYRLSAGQTKAIRAALALKDYAPTDKAAIALATTTFNCLACHVRDEIGGVSAERNLLYQTSEKNLGDPARIPPPLTLVGAKLRNMSLKKMLFDGDSVRPYMFTRMPQFGEANLRELPDLFARVDTIEEFALNIPKAETEDKAERKREEALRHAGRDLVGDKGLYCIACHNFNGKPSPNYKGIDLMTFYQRLKPSWFYHFVKNPVAFRPGIVMPFAWPGGVAVHKNILDGDTDRQILAIWYYLSLGTSANDPPGIQAVETKIEVTDVPRTYRGRSSVAGFRGIAVGFPARIHYAFNAETGTLTAIWQGDFIRVDRSGQGSGGFNPLGRSTALAQDVSFFDLPDEKTAWPLRPVMTKAAPVNPDPLYPKNRGYQFRGYFMDEDSIPTFMYRTGEIEVEDCTQAETDGGKRRLKRTIQFTSPRNHTTWFRALTGPIEHESKPQFKTADLRLTIPETPSLLRPLIGEAKGADPQAADPKNSELLLKLEIPQGKSTVQLIYEPLPK